ncbi:methyltransferase [Dactylonectria estremocensis]|uniref:Methyltransferase n=1 Tax=Dactylonectria estremocensis TaxID=1079267 RepID=A0A9P9EPZ9_9HYPO|nr:methyltransferase [Dactylonectria estremocensis]
MAPITDERITDERKTRLKESYDAIAPVYNAWTVDHSTTRMHYLDQVLQLLPRRNADDPGTPVITALELGCGAGVPVTEKLLSDERFSITANDISTTQIETAKATLGTERVDWVEGDMMALTFPDGSLDVVLGFYSIIHLPREEQDVLLERIVAWLKPGGIMLVNFTSVDSESVVAEKWLDDKGWMFWSGWGADAMLEKVKKAGLEVLTSDVKKDEGDAEFLWVIARKPKAV